MFSFTDRCLVIKTAIASTPLDPRALITISFFKYKNMASFETLYSLIVSIDQNQLLIHPYIVEIIDLQLFKLSLVLGSNGDTYNVTY